MPGGAYSLVRAEAPHGAISAAVDSHGILVSISRVAV